MRRFFVVSALWLGLLGAAEPLLACAMNSPVSECCPTGTQAPCNDDSGSADALADAHQNCCAAAPIGQPLAVSIQMSDRKPSYGTSGAADLPPVAALPGGLLAPSAALTHRPRFTDLVPSCGASTYLRTGRLRL